MNGGGKSSLFKVLALAENVPVDGYLRIAGKVNKESCVVNTSLITFYVCLYFTCIFFIFYLSFFIPHF